MALAVALTSYLPCTLAAMEAGVINEYAASRVFEATACASEDVAAEVDSLWAGRSDDRNPPALRRLVNSLLMRVDPEGYERRRQEKVAARRLEIRHGEHGSSTLFTMDQLRLDALVERCLGSHGCAGKPKAQIFVHIDLPTLLGPRDNPAELAGCGDISPEMARAIAFDADSVWNRIVDEPMTGRNRPAQYTDLDHKRAWKDGGGADQANFRPLCRVHHVLRGEPGWTFTTDE
ncbi:HNH endonuclease signature motif containing protein [Amycolatopsis minnesotensis]|uniref:HNH endonuclease signature motif containing protein n=1 Tax=Amycolatopsis minnesotensis TaxID=337894 RepID=UPI0031E2F33D